MRKVKWTDENGWKHISKVKKDDPDDMAPFGLSLDPPNVNQIDWDEVKKNLHNALVNLELSDWRDVQKHQDSIRSAVLSALKRPVIALYRIAEERRHAAGRK